MDYNKLQAELSQEKYKDLSDQEAADALNAATITTVRNIPIRDLAEWSSQNGIMPALFAAERDPATPAALYGAIKTLLTILTPGLLDSWEVLGASGEPTSGANGLMTGLIQAGLMTTEQAGELAAMAMTKTSWAALYNDGQPVGDGHVASARGA
jgi:hypothetical protein